MTQLDQLNASTNEMTPAESTGSRNH